MPKQRQKAIKPLKDIIIISVENEYIQKIGSLYTDPETNPTEYATTSGKIERLCLSASEKYRNDLNKIEVGDIAVFSYKLFDVDGGDAMKVFNYFGEFVCPLRWLFCVIKPDGRIVMMDSWTMGEYLYSDNAVEVEDERGHKILVEKTKFGIELIAKPLPNQATIINDPAGELSGKKVYHAEAADWVYNVPGLGEKLIIQRDLIYGFFN